MDQGAAGYFVNENMNETAEKKAQLDHLLTRVLELVKGLSDESGREYLVTAMAIELQLQDAPRISQLFMHDNSG